MTKPHASQKQLAIGTLKANHQLSAQQIAQLEQLAVAMPNFNHAQELDHTRLERRYFRFYAQSGASLIAVLAEDRSEMLAFIDWAQHFFNAGIPVPRVIAVRASSYLISDGGQRTLAQCLQEWTDPAQRQQALEQSLYWLVRLQNCTLDGLKRDLPRLNQELFMADVQAFIDGLAKINRGADFNHQLDSHLIEACRTELQRLAEQLGRLPQADLVYRDFQPRNIMWNDAPLLIDFQSIHHGHGLYDLASFLSSNSSKLSLAEQNFCIDTYCRLNQPAAQALEYLPHLILMRRIQALAAYARLGWNNQLDEGLDKLHQAAMSLKAEAPQFLNLVELLR